MQSFFGLHHIGLVVDNSDNAKKFYTKVMGGMQTQIDFPLPATYGETMDDILDANEAGINQAEYGIPNSGW